MPKSAMTRRSACVLVAGSAATLFSGALFGCSSSASSSSSSGARTGFSTDTEVKEGPVTLNFCLDSNLQYYAATDASSGDADHISECIRKYQAQEGRSEVSVNVTYLPAREISERATGAGFQEFDAVICADCTMDNALAAGTLEAGNGGYQLRSFISLFRGEMHLVRSRNSSAVLPDAATLDGKDSSDGKINRLQRLGEAEGAIAVADPNTEPEGAGANRLLAFAGLYSESEGTGGQYTGGLEADGKVQVFESQDAAMAAVESGACAFGFAFAEGLTKRFSGVQDYYTPPNTSPVVYEGAVPPSSSEPGVARDFMQYMTMLV